MPTQDAATTTEQTDATVTEATATDATTTTEVTDHDDTDQVAKWKALARKHEQNAKANAEKAKRLDELEEASKTELEKAQARAEAAEKAFAEATATALRATVAADKGVPAALLTGSTQEELEAAADALLAFKGATPKAPPADGQGKVGTPVTGPTQWTRDDLKGKTPAEIDAAREAGHLRDLLNPKTT